MPWGITHDAIKREISGIVGRKVGHYLLIYVPADIDDFAIVTDAADSFTASEMLRIAAELVKEAEAKGFFAGIPTLPDKE